MLLLFAAATVVASIVAPAIAIATTSAASVAVTVAAVIAGTLRSAVVRLKDGDHERRGMGVGLSQ